ncbi:2'-5' RNA ligase family protein [Flavobacterium amnicola]|uniref:2'-5' RNA ligase family protein n=1 Tax=Flavobacterium amnicola TaxID=2506422 RepID=A0A4Q1K0Q1_9FLAO|nr:2'-5' RNA ligase family protein [Flavobacterium amnicola]RXR16320.1 2'-5' RNA ligase family protein [Flavobacterium amnicola]
MSETFSIVLQPAPEVIDKVKTMKNELAYNIGWYNSRNSLAHITVNEFEANPSDLKRIVTNIDSICNTIKPTEAFFDSLDTFPNGAFFLSPDLKTRDNLKSIMTKINTSFRLKTKIKSNEPHISIGRRLNDNQIKKAKELFGSPNVSFRCDTVALRKFNTEKKQFDIIALFELNGNDADCFPSQGTLF